MSIKLYTNSALYRALRKNNTSGIAYADSQQLFLWIFTTLDVLPEDLRDERLTKEKLASIFENLEKRGTILPPSRDDEIVPWHELVGAFLSDDLELDQEFKAQIGRCFDS